MGEILIGTSSWTDKTLLESGWYPREAKTAEARLAFYAQNFDVVEVDATYYALPSERNAVLWVERTPPHFTFNVKAYSMLTQHPTNPRALPKKMRERLNATKNVYPKDLLPGMLEEAFEMFASALMPLHSAGKLGFILFQFPEWFMPGRTNRAYVERCAELLADYRIAVEFRQRAWLAEPTDVERTLGWLSDLNLPFVCVDMPQGFASSMPPVVAATADDISIVRFHGRNTQTWKTKGLTTAERFNYDYSDDELKSWQPRLFELAEQTRRTHAMFNNCYRDNAVRNAARLADLLGQTER